MPSPKKYNYTLNDVIMIPGAKRLFLDFRDGAGLFVPSFREDNVCYCSLARKRFTAILSRCNPNNRDFTGAENHFSDFQEFAEWMVCQKFYGLPNYSVDKDLFYDGGVMRYSKETCCLIPAELNSNLMDYKHDYCTFEKQRNKFRCRVRYTPFGGMEISKFIGRFDTAEECAEVHRIHKTEIMREIIAESFKDHIDDRVYNRLKEWSPKFSRA